MSTHNENGSHADEPQKRKESLPIHLIQLDLATQVRVHTNPATINEYMEAMLNGAKFPPPVVFFDGENYWLADGMHRVKATRGLGRTEIDAEVHCGRKRDALLYAVRANTSHGLKMSNADKNKVINLLLQDQEWARWSDTAIARHCGVSDRFVAKLRKASPNGSQMRKVSRDGTTFDMDTSSIGKSRQGQDGPESQEPAEPRDRYAVLVVGPTWIKMSFSKVKAMSIGDHAEAAASLWLSTDNAHLLEALELVQLWGFHYHTMVTLVEGDQDMNFTSHCIVATRGETDISLTKHLLQDEAEFFELLNERTSGAKATLCLKSGHVNRISP